MPTIKRLSNLPAVPCRGEPLGSPVFWLGVQWAVTSDGVERRDGFYVIERDRIHEAENGHTWEDHIGAKDWADLTDFRAAMAFARRKWPEPKNRAAGADRPGRSVASCDMIVSAARSIVVELRKVGRSGFVEIARHGRRGRAHIPAEQVLAFDVQDLPRVIQILRQAEASAVRHGLLSETCS